MSRFARTNLDVVQSIFEAWERGDYSSADWAHSEIEFILVSELDPDSSTGMAEMGNAWRDWLSYWEDFRTEAREYREVDAERVLVLTEVTGRGRGSGFELGRMPTAGAILFHLRDGKVTTLTLYIDAEGALDDLGLASSGDSLPS